MSKVKDLSPHSRNLRKGRYSESGRIYFVTSSCYKRRKVFFGDRAAEILSTEFFRIGENGFCENLAFVVMPDHFHWLVQLQGGSSLSQAVRLVKGRSARCVNRGRLPAERIWQPSFHDHALRRDEDLEGLANYLIHNPLRAGLVKRLDEYRYWWSKWHSLPIRRG